MSETLYGTQENEQAGSFERLKPEALAFAEREGYAHIKGLATAEECTLIAGGFDGMYSRAFLNQGAQVKGRYAYSKNDKPPATWLRFKNKLGRTIQQAAGGDPDFALWGHKAVEGIEPVASDTFRYTDDEDFAKHVDNKENGFPTQVIVTWRGSATFKVFDSMDDEAPKAAIKVMPGEAIILRGDEKQGGQLPHCVEDIKGNRLITAFYPARTFSFSVSNARYKRERNERWERNSQPKLKRVATTVGRQLVAAVRRPAEVPKEPNTRPR